MKKILLIAVAVLSTAAVNAKVWRVNPNEAAIPDFLSVTDATAAKKVNAGDTLYIEAGTYAGDQRITKSQLTLIGPGWEIPTNFGSTSTIATAYFTGDLNVAADTITLVGLKMAYISLRYQDIRDLTIERCMIGRITSENLNYERTIKNITIRNNFFNSNLYGNNGPVLSFRSTGYILNVSVENNLFVNYSEASEAWDYATMIIIQASTPTNTSAQIAHNTIICKMGYTGHRDVIEAAQTVIRDNIIINTTTYGDYNNLYLQTYDPISTCEFYNNVLSIPAENAPDDLKEHFANNFYGATLSNTFTQTILNNAEETYFMLKEGSVAAGKAYMGEDCGAFAGSWPFIVNGRPKGLPYIYDVLAPNYPTDNQMNISFKVKANNL